MKLSSMNCPSYDMSFYMKYLCNNRSGLCYFQGEGGIFLNSKFKHFKRWLHSLLLLLIFPGGYAPPNSPGRGTFHVLIFRNVYFSCTIRIYFFLREPFCFTQNQFREVSLCYNDFLFPISLQTNVLDLR